MGIGRSRVAGLPGGNAPASCIRSLAPRGGLLEPWGRGSVDLEQLHVEDQVRAGGDNVSGSTIAVAHVRRDLQCGALAQGHLHDALVPAADHLTHADLERERLVAVAARVELLAVGGERACVVHGQRVARVRVRRAVTRRDCLDDELAGRGSLLGTSEGHGHGDGLASHGVVEVQAGCVALNVNAGDNSLHRPAGALQRQLRAGNRAPWELVQRDIRELLLITGAEAGITGQGDGLGLADGHAHDTGLEAREDLAAANLEAEEALALRLVQHLPGLIVGELELDLHKHARLYLVPLSATAGLRGHAAAADCSRARC
mmetsp:Transcript_27694/g.70073  ORF Transcript_27694/g.70073 Transcript_27694/m.70073 type:complete len:316 (+) Transcript_27694:1-948(+)